MINLIVTVAHIFLLIFKSKKSLICEVAVLKKEVEILKRKRKKRTLTNRYDRVFFILIHLLQNIKDHISIVKPETVLRWQREIIRRNWTYNRTGKKRGRKATPKEIHNLILNIKNDNLLWGVKRIQGELLKLGISLDSKTIWNILSNFRKKGKIKNGLTWETFLKIHIQSIYAMDFFTIDTILNQRFYVFFIISHKTREIVRYAITQYPVKEFVRQQLIDISEELNRTIYLLHDNAVQFKLRYSDYMMKGIATSVQAPKMNSIAERFVGSVRREALDRYIILSQKQLNRVLKDYIHYYNSLRPHQGLDQQIPKGYLAEESGDIMKIPMLSGLHHHYFRRAA